MDYLADVSKQGGLLGTLLVLAIIGLVTVTKMLLNEKDLHLKDAKEYRDTIAEPLRQLNQTMSLIVSNYKNGGQ